MKTEEEVNRQQDKIQTSEGDLMAGDMQIQDLSSLVPIELVRQLLFSYCQSS